MFTYTDEEYEAMAQGMKKMICVGCGKQPHEIKEYYIMAREELNEDSESSLDAYDDLNDDEINEIIDRWAWYHEGTMNWENGHFACTECYIQMGMPSSPRGWKAP